MNRFNLISLIITIGVVIVLIALFLSTQKGGLPQTTQNVPAIQNTSGLNSVASELDNTDLNELDKELNQLDADASTF